jgi:hypothetical protein
MEWMNKTRIRYMYIWKCHNEIPCVTIIYQLKRFYIFFKNAFYHIRVFSFCISQLFVTVTNT